MNTLVKTNGNGRSLFNGFPTLFDDFFTRDLEFINGRRNNTLPAVNIKENENAYVLELAVPGMAKEDFTIELKNDLLTISAKKENSSEQKDEEGKFICRQFGFQSFSRSFTLPKETTNEDQISAAYTNGVLNVTIPKKEKESNVKQIRIG